MLATESGKTANQVSETIVTELINKQIIENISDNWGFPVADCYERDVTVVEMVDVIGQLVFTRFVPSIWTPCWNVY